MITKGYMTADEVYWSCPAETMVYEKIYKLQQAKADEQAWLIGMYMVRAIGACFGKNSEYPKEPITKSCNYGLTDEQKKKKDIELFKANMQAMALSWQSTHRNNEVKGEIE